MHIQISSVRGPSMSGNSDTKESRHTKNHVAKIGLSGQKWATFFPCRRHVADMSLTFPAKPSDEVTTHQNWMTFSKCWCEYNEAHNNSINKHNYSMNNVFANRSNEEEIYPLTVKEIAEAQKLDRHFKATALKEKYESTLIENT